MKYFKLIVLSVLCFSSVAKAQVSSEEKQALIDLYNATDGANWTNNTNWLTNTPVNDWYGVTVVENKVLELTLLRNNVNGTLPESLGRLINLKSLAITSASLKGAIPTSIEKLINLETLNLSSNKLNVALPPELGKMTQLTSLNLYRNNIPGAIPPALGSLTNLTILSLGENALEGSIPSELGGLTNLISLILFQNQLSNSIPIEIGDLVNLEDLNLGRNLFSGAIPASIEKLINLEILNLSSNQLNVALPPELGKMTQLTSLNLFRNNIPGAIPPALGSLANLTNLSLGENALEGSIPSELRNLTNLTSLNLFQNQLTDSIPLELEKLVNLTSLNIGRNELTASIPNFTNITTLSAQSNRFIFSDLELYKTKLTADKFSYSPQAKVDEEETLSVGEGGSITLTSTALTSPNNSYQWYKNGVAITGATTKNYVIENATDADVGDYYFTATNSIVDGLTLTRNTITLKVTEAIVDACGVSAKEKQALLDLYTSTNGDNWTNTLANNKPWRADIPVCDWFGVVVVDGGVTDVVLSGNNLNGPISPSIKELISLKSLYLRVNQISGSIPIELIEIITLEDLYLDNNLLTGTIPKRINKLINLKDLVLIRNNISGNIPLEIGQLSNLEILQLGVNNLSGNIPKELGELTNLKIFGVTSNQLSGQIPNEIGRLSNLNTLHLDSNFLTGDIPINLIKLTKLRSLIVRKNNFVFSNFEEEHLNYKNNLSTYRYSPQAKVDAEETLSVIEGNSITLTSAALTSPNNSYQWYKNGVAITGATTKNYVIESATDADVGTYYFTATNSIVDGLTLTRNTITLEVTEAIVDACGVSAKEKQALLDLYNSTNGDNWTNTLANNKPWRADIPVCDWFGVTVVDGEVITILISNNSMVGTIPNSLRDLGNLKILSITGNRGLTGNIPKEIGDLVKLNRIQLFGNKLNGSIPDELSNLININFLSLGNNELTGKLPKWLGSLPFLVDLRLYQNNFTGLIPYELANASNLRLLQLYSNELSGEIPLEFGQLVNMQNLDLRGNKLIGNIPQSINSWSKLQTINLSSNLLTGEIPIFFSEFSDLKWLRLSNNKFEGNLPNALANLSNIEDIQVQRNQLTGIFPNFTNNASITRLRFYDNGFVFSNFEDEHLAYKANVSTYNYSPQAKVDQEETLSVGEGGSITLTSTALTSPNNSYQWYKNGVAITGATTKNYVIENATDTDFGDYYFTATNSVIEGLTLTRNTITLEVTEAIVDACGVSAKEKQALLDLYNSTNGDNWTNTLANNKPWRADIPVCDWFGVTVVDGKVTEISLISNGLAGIIPASIGNLVNAEKFNLERNAINGSIPPELGNMINLLSLNLYKNSITGSIPIELSNLTNLTGLTLGENLLTGSIPPEFGNMTKLTSLSFFHNQLTGEIPSELGDLVNLVFLNFGINRLTGSIPESIDKLTNLRFLELQTNLLTGSIPPSIGNLSNLERVYLYQNQLVGALPNALGSLPNLQYLDVSNNQLSGTIPNGLGTLLNLKSLLLNVNDFSGSIPKGLSSLAISNSFERLIFTSNSFVFSDFEDEYITYKNELTRFNYSPQAKVDEEETLSVVEGGSITLTSVDLTSENNSYQWYKNGVAITGATTKNYVIESATDADFGDYYFTATNSVIEGLTLTRNTITLEVTEAIVDACGVSAKEKQALLDLYTSTNGDNWTNTLANNKPWRADIPVCDWFGVTVVDGKVTKLIVTSNNLSGNLNVSIRDLLDLRSLDLEKNSISGTIESIIELRNLSYLELSENQFEGNIPSQINNLTLLGYLNLADNQLSGEIPSTLGELGSLRDLYLQNNQLNGSIPAKLGDLSKLRLLSLSRNKLTGLIPIELSNLKETLKDLRLSNNLLSGSIPKELGMLENVENLILQSNLLQGSIPIELKDLTKLKFLNLKSNNFNGFIPDQFLDLNDFNIFNIGDNNFVFSHLEDNLIRLQDKLTAYGYSPQAKVDEEETLSVSEGGSITLTSTALTSPNNSYQWYKNGVAITGATTKNYVIESATDADVGDYYFTATNSIVDGLTLTRNTITLKVTEAIVDACGVSAKEKQALLDLYTSTNGDNWTNTLANNKPWRADIPVCDWFGVVVVDGEVQILDMFNNNIDGQLIESLKDLQSLKELNLGNNKLIGIIPDSLYSLVNLEELNLRNNKLNGVISNQIEGLLNLRQLYLTSNEITGSIPSELGNLSNLETLFLSQNKLTGNIPPNLSKLSNLKSLNLGFNSLTGNIPKELEILSNLRKLTLAVNNFEGNISFSFDSLENLNFLDLSSNNFIGEIILSDIESVNLSDNSFSGKVPDLTNTTDLRSYFFKFNSFVFSDFERGHIDYIEKLHTSNYGYSPQAKVDEEETLSVVEGGSITLTSVDLTSENNSYQWYKNGVAITGATTKNYVIESATDAAVGDYYFTATNSVIEGLTLTRNTITLEVTEAIVDACGVSAKEKQALLDLYTSTNGDNWTNTLANNKPWRADIPVCDWFGITVIEGKVTKLIVTSNNLSGNIPDNIGDLINLTGFFAQNNNLETIPPSIGNLIQLTDLYLSNNKISTPIPTEIGKLYNLRILYLGRNNIPGIIPDEINDLRNLRFLHLQNNKLSGRLPSQLGEMQALEVFYVFDNNLSENIPDSLGDLKNLRTIGLQGNNFSQPLPSNWRNLINLSRLSFDNNNFIFSDFENSHSSFKTNAIVLYDYSPQAKVDEEETLSVSEGGSITLTSTALTSPNNSYQWYKNGVAITGATTKNYVIESATDADVGDYYFTATNSVIEGLTLTRNTITLEVTEAIVDACGVSAKEKQALLDLYNSTNGDNWTNTLAGNKPWRADIPVCDWFGVTVKSGNVIKLQVLRNKLVGEIPSTIGDLSSLEVLELSGGDFEGTKIPSEIGNLSNLEHLELINCKLLGKIPIAITNLLKLKYLRFNSNKLSGVIHPEFGNLENLEFFDLGQNSLSGNIPSQIGNFSKLTNLNFHRNLLTGNIPPQIGNLTLLTYLSLSGNNLDGNIPNELSNLGSLINLYLSVNNLRGTIPFSITELPDLNITAFDQNNFVFNDFETNHAAFYSNFQTYRYSPQAKVDEEETLSIAENESITLTSTALTSPNNSYQWYKNGVAITGATTKNYVIESATGADVGTYYFEATNSIVDGLTLTRNTITLEVTEREIDIAPGPVYNCEDPCNILGNFDNVFLEQSSEEEDIPLLFPGIISSPDESFSTREDSSDLNLWYPSRALISSGNYYHDSDSSITLTAGDIVDSPQGGGYFVGYHPGDGLVLNLRYGTIDVNIGEEYIISFYQIVPGSIFTNLNGDDISSESKVDGRKGRWHIFDNFHSGRNGIGNAIAASPDMEFSGFGNQRWEYVEIRFTPNTSTIKLDLVPDYNIGLLAIDDVRLSLSSCHDTSRVTRPHEPSFNGCEEIVNTPNLIIADAPDTIEGENAIFPIRLSEASNEDITITFVPELGTANLDDFETTPVQITFLAGETTKTVIIPTTEDDLIEATENFILKVQTVDFGSVEDFSDTGSVLIKADPLGDDSEETPDDEDSDNDENPDGEGSNNNETPDGEDSDNDETPDGEDSGNDDTPDGEGSNNNETPGSNTKCISFPYVSLADVPYPEEDAQRVRWFDFDFNDSQSEVSYSGDIDYDQYIEFIRNPELLDFTNPEIVSLFELPLDIAVYPGEVLWAEIDGDSSNLTRVELPEIEGLPLLPNDGDEFEPSYDQSFLPITNPRVKDLRTISDNVLWFSSTASEEPLDEETILINNENYYAAFSVDGCRRRIYVDISVPNINTNGFRSFCENDNAIIADLDITPSCEGCTIKWYTDSRSFTTYETTTILENNKFYYAAQIDSLGNESIDRKPILISLSSAPPITILSNTQVVYFKEGEEATVSQIRVKTNGDVRWYLEPDSTEALEPDDALINEHTYYGTQYILASECESSERVAVTITLAPELPPEFILCEKFRPNPGDTYVFSGWVRQQQMEETSSITRSIVSDPVVKPLFLDLLNFLVEEYIFNETSFIDQRALGRFIPKILVPSPDNDSRKYDPLKSFIIDSGSDNLTIYNFKYLQEDRISDALNIRGKVTTGFQFSFKPYSNTNQYDFKFLMPNYNTVDRYPILNQHEDIMELAFNDLKINSSGLHAQAAFTFNSDYKGRIAVTNTQGSYLSEPINNVLSSRDFKQFKPNLDYQVKQYDKAFVRVIFEDREEAVLSTDGEVIFTAKGSVIEGWQRISGQFKVPNDAYLMTIELKNSETNDGINAYFDDIRVHPVNSNLKSFVYDPITQRLIAEMDENNYATFYEYDKEGGLIRVKKETERGVFTIQETRSGNSILNTNE